MYVNGQLIGVIGIDIGIESIQIAISATKILQNGYGYVVDTKGITVFHPKLDLGAVCVCVYVCVCVCVCVCVGCMCVYMCFRDVREREMTVLLYGVCLMCCCGGLVI